MKATKHYYFHLPNKRTNMIRFYEVLRQIYVMLTTILELILRKIQIVWLNQVFTTSNKEGYMVGFVVHYTAGYFP